MGKAKRLRRGKKVNWALAKGTYPISGHEIGPGMLRARARLNAHRKAQNQRLAGVDVDGLRKFAQTRQQVRAEIKHWRTIRPAEAARQRMRIRKEWS